jgi:hypothetical protein
VRHAARRPEGEAYPVGEQIEAALGAVAVFLTPSPAFLAYPRTRRQANGRSHATSLWGMGEIPCAQQIRTLRAPSDPAPLLPVCEGVSAALERAAPLGAFRTCAGQLRLAFEGTDDVSSPAMHGDRCSQRTQRHGPVTSVHPGIPPSSSPLGTPR